MAHEVVQARNAVGRTAEEHGRVAEDLSQPGVGEPPIDVARERPGQQGRELAGAAQERGIAQPGGASRTCRTGSASPTARMRRPPSRGRHRASRPLPARSPRTAPWPRRDRTGRRWAGGAGRRSADCRRGTRGPGGTRSSSRSAVVPSSRKKCSNTSGIRYQLGPVSKRKPSCSHDPARPPSSSRASRTVTSQPSAPSSAAVARPAMPAPITTAAPFSSSAMCDSSVVRSLRFMRVRAPFCGAGARSPATRARPASPSPGRARARARRARVAPQAHRERGEEVVCRGHRSPAVRGEARE